jgi:hypothetical protein
MFFFPYPFIGLLVASFIAKQHSPSPTDLTYRVSLLLGTCSDHFAKHL